MKKKKWVSVATDVSAGNTTTPLGGQTSPMMPCSAGAERFHATVTCNEEIIIVMGGKLQ